MIKALCNMKALDTASVGNIAHGHDFVGVDPLLNWSLVVRRKYQGKRVYDRGTLWNLSRHRGAVCI